MKIFTFMSIAALGGLVSSGVVLAQALPGGTANPRGYFFKMNSANDDFEDLKGTVGDKSNPNLFDSIGCIGDQGAEDEFTLGCNGTDEVTLQMDSLTPVFIDGKAEWTGGMQLSGPGIVGGPINLTCKSVLDAGGGVVLPITCN